MELVYLSTTYNIHMFYESGCAATAIENVSWGSIKQTYR